MTKNDKKYIWVVFIVVGIMISYLIWTNGISRNVGIISNTGKSSETRFNQESNCSSEKFKTLLDKADAKTQIAHFDEAMELYRQAYNICPMKDIEEQMAWLLTKISDQ